MRGHGLVDDKVSWTGGLGKVPAVTWPRQSPWWNAWGGRQRQMDGEAGAGEPHQQHAHNGAWGVENAQVWCGRRGLTFVRHENEGEGGGRTSKEVMHRPGHAKGAARRTNGRKVGHPRIQRGEKAVAGEKKLDVDRNGGRRESHRQFPISAASTRGLWRFAPWPFSVWHWVGPAAWLGGRGSSHSACLDAKHDDSGSSMSREDSRHGPGPQPAVDMTAEIHGVGSRKDGQEQQLQLARVAWLAAQRPASPPSPPPADSLGGPLQLLPTQCLERLERPQTPASSGAEPGFGILPPSNMGQLADQCGQGFQINGTAPVHWCRHV